MTFDFKGRHYRNVSALFEAGCTVSRPSLEQRLLGGWSVEQSMTTPKGFMPGKPTFIFNGVKYPSVRALHGHNKSQINVSYLLFLSRIKEGMTPDEAAIATKKKTGTIFIEPQVIEGHTYTTIPEIAEAYGIKTNTMFKRYSRGHRGNSLIKMNERKDYVEKVSTGLIASPKLPRKDSKIIEFRGKEYSIYGITSEFDVNRKTFTDRMSRGATVEQALGLKVFSDGRMTAEGVRSYEYNGQEMTIAQIAKLEGIPSNTLRNRLRRGVALEQALSKERLERGVLAHSSVKKRAKKPRMVVDGVEYSSYAKLAAAYGLKYYVVYQRITLYGLTPEEAVKNEGKSKPLIVDGVTYDSMKLAAEKFGVAINTLYARAKEGWTPRQVVGLDAPPYVATYGYEGEMLTIEELSEKSGVSGKLLTGRISNGHSATEAIAMGSEKVLSTGRYNLTILERDQKLASSPSEIYLVRIRIDERVMYKIGVTTQTVKQRLKQERVDWEEILVARGTLLECYQLEQEIHHLMEDKNIKDVDGSIMDGYTELFSFNESDVEAVQEIMAEHFSI
jgi:hypothetical protein